MADKMRLTTVLVARDSGGTREQPQDDLGQFVVEVWGEELPGQIPDQPFAGDFLFF